MLKLKFIFSITLLSACLGWSSTACVATETLHPISVVDADIYVTRFRTVMRLSCFAEDLEMLQGVSPLENGLYDPEEIADATQDHAKYLAEEITLRDANGELIPAKVTEIVDVEIPDEGIKAGTLMEYQMGFVLEYVYDAPPEFITIEQNMVADGALLPSELKIVLKQAGVDAPYTHLMKPEHPQTFRFDWSVEPLPEEASEEEQEKWFEEWFAKQREKTLGITSYSSVYSFVYINDHEARHEVLIPLATLATMMEFEREEESFLSVDEQELAVEKIKTFFFNVNPVAIDGIEVQPVFDRIDFYGLDLTDFAMQSEKRRVSMASGRAGVIMSYSTKGPPSKVEVTWDVFNKVIRSVDSVILAYDDVEKTQFSTFLPRNTFEWTAPEREPLPPLTGVDASIDLESLKHPTLNIPMLSACLLAVGLLVLLCKPILGFSGKAALGWILLAGIGALATSPLYNREFPCPIAQTPVFEIEEPQAAAIFSQLHKNLFRAFDYRDESEVYDALAHSIEGPLLRKLYLQINRSLKIAEQGGATAHIDEVNLIGGKKIEREIKSENAAKQQLAPNLPAFAYRARWQLIGTIEHWGHIHERTNEYDAQFQVRLVDGDWKITDMTMLDEQPGEVKTGLRKF